MSEAHGDGPNYTHSSKVSAYIMSANISLVKLSHVTYHGSGSVCLVLQ